MSLGHWDQQFFSSTRGRIIVLLRRAGRTVKQLAEPLALTDNAVRARLAVLQRDGLVQQQPVHVGVGKPAYMYSLTPQAERLFPKAYGLLSRQMLDILVERSDATELQNVLDTLGQRLASIYPAPLGDKSSRLKKAVEVLNELGGMVQLEEANEHFEICGYVCPLSEVTLAHPEVCGMMATMLSE